MNEKYYLLISATIFALAAILHFVRLFSHWSFQIGVIAVPVWGSWLAVLIGATLSIWAFRLFSQWNISHQ